MDKDEKMLQDFCEYLAGLPQDVCEAKLDEFKAGVSKIGPQAQPIIEDVYQVVELLRRARG